MTNPPFFTLNYPLVKPVGDRSPAPPLVEATDPRTKVDGDLSLSRVLPVVDFCQDSQDFYPHKLTKIKRKNINIAGESTLDRRFLLI
jgi:hypothetical protein